MKLIIDIPKERLDSIKHFGIKQNEVSMLERALISGTPLPKEHGRLIDADVLVDGLEDDYEFCGAINATPTIIEAERGE